MPVAKDPGAIKTGSGKTALSPTDKLVLLGASMAGAPPNVGQPGYLPADSTSLGDGILGFPSPTDDPGSAGLLTHVGDPVDAHHASAIGLVPDSKVMFNHTVQGVIDEFASGVAARPPMLGQTFTYMGFSGIPDWGSLKLYDTDIRPQDEYPYYHTFPSPTSDWAPLLADYGNDPQTDAVWNGGPTRGINGLPGTGLGLAKAGGFTDAVTTDVNRTRALALQISAGNKVVPVVVSGSVFPADRGVLALIHWPADDTVVAFLAQTSLQRVVAAIVLGSGASAGNGGCITPDSVPPITCDGSPGSGKTSANTGSIFSVGLDALGNYDPFAYPSQAGGQYDLHEINTGISDATGEPLPGVGAFPWWGDGWKRVISSVVPGAGQVRWGTDPSADPTVVTSWGIPVLGADLDWFAAGPGGPVDVVNPYGGLVNYANTWGSTIITDSNFFRYRLPYLKDYSRATGLKYTPRGLDAYTTRETKRYFDVQALYTSDPTRMTNDGTDHLNQAGNYDDFTEDHWSWQLGRYRHSFYIPGSDTPRELGTYWMIHFKTERDFESFVRDGHMPWDPSPDGYEVYGVTPVDTSAVASNNNLVNSAIDLSGDPGTGPATSGYGYGSKSYHILRSTLITANNTTQPASVTADYIWTLNAPAATPGVSTVMFVSGVAYFVPVNADGLWAFDLNDINLSISNPWIDFYRVDDNDLTNDSPQIAPARLSSPCPMFMGIAPFAYETLLTVPTHIQDTVFGGLTPRYQRLEVPFQFLGAFSDVNGPVNADNITVTSLGTGVKFPGDVNQPAFSSDAMPMVFVRRPLATTPIQPTNAIMGNGIPLVPTAGVAAASVLFHSTAWNAAVPAAGHYGNFITGAAPSVTHSALATATKDVQERFLDETYRYYAAMGGDLATNSLVGPGMVGWAFGPIPTPVQIGRTTATYTDPFLTVTTWNTKSYAQNEEYLNSLAVEELQVAGLPVRNPSFPSGAEVPFPSSGILLHPQKDYSVGYVPDNTAPGGGLTLPQVDYSALAAGTRSYVRCFDASFVRGLSPTAYDGGVVGQPFVVFRIDGLTLDDFQYTAPGYGGLGDGITAATYTGIAIMVKVPGLTTWMDLGRVDGDGPSKQDPNLDGAGCQVVGPNTLDGVDAVTGMVYCQVKVNVGPAINLAEGQESSPGSGRYEVPVLVKVVMNDLAKDYNLEQEYTGHPGQFGGVVKPGAAPEDVRGLCGIQVVYPTLVEVTP